MSFKSPCGRSLLISVLLLSTILPAQDRQKTKDVRNVDFIPQRIMLTVGDDAAHAQAVTWRTEKPEESAQAQFALASANPDFEKLAQTVTATVAHYEVSAGRTVGEYAVTFKGLNPNSRYSYRVGDGKTWSEWNTFRTASDKADKFKFLYLGDEQNSIRSLWSRSVRSAYSHATDARFIVHAGDLVAEGYDDDLWGEWFDAMGFISATIPSFPTPGNHDLHRAPGRPDSQQVLSVSPIWRYQFSLPTNGPKGTPELNQQSYYMDYQGVRFISLDVNVYANEAFAASERQRVAQSQTAWLEEILKNNPNRWTVVVQHQPIYAIAKGREYEEMRAVLAPLYDKYHVDLVLQGHDHGYARTNKLFGGKVVPLSQPGTVYAISVSGPKMYEPAGRYAALMAKEVHNTEAYQVIEVDGRQLTYRAYSIEGDQIDEFQLEKQK